MIKLSERLNAVASLVRADSVLADIGCDHGFLPVYLIQSGKIQSAVSSDINAGPLSACRALVEKERLENHIRCVLSDGLKEIKSDMADDISVCGMGGELIVQILEACPWVKSKDKHYIFNPMTHPEILRKYLSENGFEIDTDIIVKEGNRYYNVFDACYTGNCFVKDDVYYFLGNIKNFEHKEYFRHLLNYLENKQKGGTDYGSVIAAVKEKL